jgi:hypothetical protein
VSADGTYYEYKCPVFPALPIPDYVDKETESPWNIFDDFEDGKLRFEYISNSTNISNSPGKKPYKIKKDLDGNSYLEITVKHKWNKCCRGNFHTERAEIYHSEKRAKEKVVWYGFKVRLPKDFIHIDDRVMFSQFKNQIKSICASPSPLLGFRFRKEGKKLNIGGDNGGVCKGEESLKKYRIQFDYRLMNKKWYPIKLKHKEIEKYGIITVDLMSGIEPFDATPLGEWTTYKVGIYNTKKDSGFVKVYKDDILIFDYEGVTFDWKGSYNDTVVKIGLYRDSKPEVDWSKCSGDKTVDYIPLFCYGMDNKLIPKSERKKNLTDSEGYPPQSIHYDDFTVVSDKKTLDKYLN